ncbi:MAG TPA: hypothetical protein VD994_01270 [Prosthecobacter sp.]|nr:hypothetical protein [Prosthecobacter sp.]
MPEDETVCGNCGCGAPVGRGEDATDKVKRAGGDAWQAVKTFAGDPIAKLAPAFEALGEARAVGAGVVFGTAFAFSVLLGLWRVLPEVPAVLRPEGLGGFLKMVFAAFVPFMALTFATLLGRKCCGGKGGLGHDCFVAGATLLPFGGVVVVTLLVGLMNLEVVVLSALAASCLAVLILFTGLTRIAGLTERSATIAVPLMLIGTSWFAKILYVAMIDAREWYGM